MSDFQLYKKNPTAGEITSSLTGSNDGQGLHFDGAAGNIDIASPPDLGTKFSFEFIVQSDDWATGGQYLVDFATSGRFTIGRSVSSSNLQIYDTGWRTFGVAPLDDGKVHHLVVTVDDTAAILYDNGNQIGTATLGATPTVDAATDAKIGAYSGSPTSDFLNGTIYRARFWNKTLSAPEVTASFEQADVPFADQYGSQSEKMPYTTDRDFSGANNWLNVDLDSFNSTGDLTVSSTGGAQECRLAEYGAPMIGGKSYRVTVTASALSGDGFTIRDFDNVVMAKSGTLYRNGTYVSDSILQLADGANVFEFVYAGALGASNGGLMVRSDGTGGITCDDFSVREIGCVADYDLAFANPTQSDQVQDRAGAADGTASSGVTQVTKIEQLNANKISVGGTTPKFGLGLAAGSTPNYEVLIAGANNPSIQICDTDLGVAATDGFVLQQASSTSYVWNYETGDMILGTSNTQRLRIDSAGNVGIGVTPESWYSGFTAIQLSDTGAIWSENIGGESVMAIGENIYMSTGGAYTYLTTDEASSYIQSNGTHSFKVAASGTADTAISWTDALTIDSAGLATFSNGIAFSSQTDATGTGITSGATTLEHYERGLWTPEVRDATSGGNTASYTNQRGYYTRIGNVVTVAVSLVNIDTTGMTSGNAAYITGFPFAAGYTIGDLDQLGRSVGNLVSDSINYAATNAQATPIIYSSDSYCAIRETLDNGADVAILVSAFNSGAADLFFTLTYFTD